MATAQAAHLLAFLKQWPHDGRFENRGVALPILIPSLVQLAQSAVKHFRVVNPERLAGAAGEFLLI